MSLVDPLGPLACVVDTETTELASNRKGQIIALSAIEVDSLTGDQTRVFQEYAAPLLPIPSEGYHNRVRTEDLLFAPPLPGMALKFREWWSVNKLPIHIFSRSFDESYLRRSGLEGITYGPCLWDRARYVCANWNPIAGPKLRKMDPRKEGYRHHNPWWPISLVTATTRLGIPHAEGAAHDDAWDSELTARLKVELDQQAGIGVQWSEGVRISALSGCPLSDLANKCLQDGGWRKAGLIPTEARTVQCWSSPDLRFLSHDWVSPFRLLDSWWQSVYHFWYSVRCGSREEAAAVQRAANPTKARKISESMSVLSHWDEVSDKALSAAVEAKFTQNPDLLLRAKAAGKEILSRSGPEFKGLWDKLVWDDQYDVEVVGACAAEGCSQEGSPLCPHHQQRRRSGEDLLDAIARMAKEDGRWTSLGYSFWERLRKEGTNV